MSDNFEMRLEAEQIGIKQGIEQGREQGRIKMILELIREGRLTISEGARRLDMGEKELEARMR